MIIKIIIILIAQWDSGFNSYSIVIVISLSLGQ